MAVAQLADVQARLERPLTDAESAVVPQLLDDVEAMILARIPDILTRAETDDQLKANLVRVESYAVIRVLRNPDGVSSETEGAYSYSYNNAVASGMLQITDAEWSLLGGSHGAYAVAPKLGDNYGRPWWDLPPWNFQYGPGL